MFAYGDEYERGTRIGGKTEIPANESTGNVCWRPRGGTRELSRLIDRLSNRLGRAAVVRACLRADAQPERAFRYVPLAGKVPVDVAQSAQPNQAKAANQSKGANRASQSTREFGLRPLYLFSSPLRVDVLNVLTNGAPVLWRWLGREHSAVQHWGPERIETGWWRGRSVCRDYYRVQTARGLRYWLFMNLDDGCWFLQGAFE